MRERDIEQHLAKRVSAAGGQVRKVNWIGRRGAPDRFVMFPGRGSFWVELKAPNGVTQPHQEREHSRMRDAGQRVVVLYSKEDVDVCLAEFGVRGLREHHAGS